jgi:hypothetical protein
MTHERMGNASVVTLEVGQFVVSGEPGTEAFNVGVASAKEMGKDPWAVGAMISSGYTDCQGHDATVENINLINERTRA